MDAFTEPRIERITWMKSARVGYTKILNLAIGYHIHQDPCSILVVEPTVDDAKGYSQDEIAPMLRDTRVLRGLVAEPRSRDSKNTIVRKSYPGGTLTLVGANSARGFRRITVRLVLFDEPDGYPPTVGREGDQISLGIKRTDTFWNRKIALGSTPTCKGASRIESSFEASDKGYYFVPCPHCGEFQRLQWENIKWPDGNPGEAKVVCVHGGCLIDHVYKRRMVEGGEWRGENWAYKDGRFTFGEMFGGHIGVHIWAAYSYSPNATWPKLAAEFVSARKDPEVLQTFMNTVRGEPWEEGGEKVMHTELMDRAEHYTELEVPQPAIFLTAGVDVQGDRLEIGIKAWGLNDESWIIHYGVIWGDTSVITSPVWPGLDSYLERLYMKQVGVGLRLAMMAIDSGFNAQTVYQYARKRQRRVMAVKGLAQTGKAILGRPTVQDVDYGGRRVPRGIKVWPIGTDTAKRHIFNRMKKSEPGPGYMHFYSALSDDYYLGLCSEKVITKYKHGVPYKEWVRIHARNEPLDVEVYAFAAAIRCGLGRLKEPSQAAEIDVVAQPLPKAETLVPVAHRMRPAHTNSGFVRNW